MSLAEDTVQLGSLLAGRVLASGTLPCSIISQEPPILAAFSWDFYRQAKAIGAALPRKRTTYLLFANGYECETTERVQEEIARYRESLDAVKADVKCTFLGNTQKEVDNLRAAGVDAVYSHQNAFLDERRYRILPNRRKIYDAVYLARVTPCKRHHLAQHIDRLLVIGGVLPTETEYAAKEMATLPQVVWKRKVYQLNVPKYFAAAHVGLCLSDREGAMYSSAEYLLCGLPVVNTPNIGGRDELFSPDYVDTVEPDAHAVAEGVRQLMDKKIDPHYIRTEALRKMEPSREAYINLLDSIFEKEEKPFDKKTAWNTFFFHKLGVRTTVSPGVSLRRLLRPNTFQGL